MEALELARKLAEHNEKADAQEAYTIALQQGGLEPKDELEAASYIFFSKGDYQLAYTTFVSLFNRGFFQAELLNIMSQAFYFPNVDKLKQQYEKNCQLLERYSYCFRKDFLPFEELPIWFFPFDKDGYIPYYPEECRFGEYVNFHTPVIDRYFFRDLEKPILAADVYSQYQLEYLNDSVRKSEWIGRENHIYLHYTNWAEFCAYLQCLFLPALLKQEKFVFLIEEEIAQYPIDFKARFGLDYSQYSVKPIGVQEVHRLIWHTQLATHNGGDFFNEIFHGHPNLIAISSIMLSNAQKAVHDAMKAWNQRYNRYKEHELFKLMRNMKNPTEKDFLVGLFLTNSEGKTWDEGARIVPALFFQPHFPNMEYQVHGSEKYKGCILTSDQQEKIHTSPLFKGFKYIKTFTPMRRITTSYAASTRFASSGFSFETEDCKVINDLLTVRMLNRSFMVNPWNRLYRDSVLVRFEDAKLNPKATFTALAEFLDIPYAETMNSCTGEGAIRYKGDLVGFDLAPVYNTYDEFANDADRALLEYCMRDAYEYYGYDFKYYHGEPVDDDWIEEKAAGAENLDKYIAQTWSHSYRMEFLSQLKQKHIDPEDPENKKTLEENVKIYTQLKIQSYIRNRVYVAKVLQSNLRFVNRAGQPLQFMKRLELNPDLLERPLYH